MWHAVVVALVVVVVQFVAVAVGVQLLLVEHGIIICSFVVLVVLFTPVSTFCALLHRLYVQPLQAMFQHQLFSVL